MIQDRNFDDLAERFQRKVYGGLKGDIRLAVLWRDLEIHVPKIYGQQPLRVLDVGGGLGQLAIRLAQLGHQVTLNDISSEMLGLAQEAAQEAGVYDKVIWSHGPFQQLLDDLVGPFDLILCHAVMEWLAEPSQLLSQLHSLLKEEGLLSLTYYNRHSLEYRNLIRGNFNLLNKDEFVPDPGSLTPANSLYPEQVEHWVEEVGMKVKSRTGIRVFHDYVTTLRGGHAVPEDVIQMELKYSQREPYLWLGRYVHLMLENGC